MRRRRPQHTLTAHHPPVTTHAPTCARADGCRRCYDPPRSFGRGAPCASCAAGARRVRRRRAGCWRRCGSSAASRSVMVMMLWNETLKVHLRRPPPPRPHVHTAHTCPPHPSMPPMTVPHDASRRLTQALYGRGAAGAEARRALRTDAALLRRLLHPLKGSRRPPALAPVAPTLPTRRRRIAAGGRPTTTRTAADARATRPRPTTRGPSSIASAAWQRRRSALAASHGPPRAPQAQPAFA